MRQWLESNAKLVTAMLIAVVLAAMGFTVMRLRAPVARAMTRAYFYDLTTGERFVSAALPPPIGAPSGPNRGVLAMVFSCGRCTPGQEFVGWLEKNSDEVQQLMQSAKAADADRQQKIDEGRLLAATPEAGAEPKWVRVTSAAAGEIKRKVRERCKDVTMCTPDD